MTGMELFTILILVVLILFVLLLLHIMDNPNDKYLTQIFNDETDIKKTN